MKVTKLFYRVLLIVAVCITPYYSLSADEARISGGATRPVKPTTAPADTTTDPVINISPMAFGAVAPAVLDIEYTIPEVHSLTMKTAVAVDFDLTSTTPKLVETIRVETNTNAPNLKLYVSSQNNGKLIHTKKTAEQIQCYMKTPDGRELPITKQKQALVTNLPQATVEHALEVYLKKGDVDAIPAGVYQGEIVLELAAQ